MKQQLEAIRKAALEAIADAGKAEDLEALRVRYLGKKGELTAVLKQMGKLSAEERPVIGQLANDVRAKLEANIEEKTKELADKAMELKLKSEAVDVTIPGKQEKIGVKHPVKSLRSIGVETAARISRKMSSEPKNHLGSVRHEMQSAPAAS